MASLNHPAWYWENYNTVFERGAAYQSDIECVGRLATLKGSCVQEIGAGTGLHAVRLLDASVRTLELIDADDKAVCLLTDKFKGLKEVTVRQGDGFQYERDKMFDVVCCMYSVAAQNCNDHQALSERVAHVMKRLRPGGVFVFETIDYNVSANIYPSGEKTIVYRRDDDIVEVHTDYLESHLRIVYDGFLQGERCFYAVNILRSSPGSLKEGLKSSVGGHVTIHPLDDYGRRILVAVNA